LKVIGVTSNITGVGSRGYGAGGGDAIVAFGFSGQEGGSGRTSIAVAVVMASRPLPTLPANQPGALDV